MQLQFSFVKDFKVEEDYSSFLCLPLIKEIFPNYFNISNLFSDYTVVEGGPSIPMSIRLGRKNQSEFPFVRGIDEECWGVINCSIIYDFEIGLDGKEKVV